MNFVRAKKKQKTTISFGCKPVHVLCPKIYIFDEKIKILNNLQSKTTVFRLQKVKLQYGVKKCFTKTLVFAYQNATIAKKLESTTAQPTIFD